jgi:FK506-binding protein 6
MIAKFLRIQCSFVVSLPNQPPFTLMREKMTAITDDEGVYKMVVKKGTGDIVTPGAICRIHYNGYLEYRDEPFDSTRLRNRQQQIRLGESMLRFHVRCN